MSSAQGGSARERHWTCAGRLRERRRQLGLTQMDVVTRLRERHADLSNRALSAMENGRGLDLGMLPDLAAVLDCSVTYLLGMAADPASWQPDQPPGAEATPARPAPETADRCAAQSSWILGPDVPDTAPRSSAVRARRSPI